MKIEVKDPAKPFRVKQSTLTSIRWVIVLAIIPFLLFATYQTITTGMDWFATPVFSYVAFGVIFLGFAWYITEGKSKQFPLEIVPEPKQVKQTTLINTNPLVKTRTARFAFFNAISSIFAVVFVLLIWVQLAVAGMNPDKVVHVFWDKFGEYHLELVLFGIIGILIIVNTIWSIKRLKHH